MDYVNARMKKAKVLVHCLMGVGRTGTMAAAYLIARKEIPLEMAYRRIIRGLRQVYYDMVANDPTFVKKIAARGLSIKGFIRERELHFPESLAQENFLKRVERDYLDWSKVIKHKRLKNPVKYSNTKHRRR